MGRASPPPAEVVLGIDVGTTAVKVSAFGLGVPFRHTVVCEYPVRRPRPGWEVQQPEVLAAAVLTALGETVAAGGGARVLALGLSCAMHGLIGLDATLRPLTPLITWADSRASDQADQLHRSGRAVDLHRRTGTPVHSMSPLTKLMWLRQNASDVVERVAHWVGLKDWVILSLTGTIATELSSASGTGLLELATGTWSAECLELAGVEEACLPPILDTTAALGLAAPVARRIGLPTALPVVLGAGDGPLGNVGTGAFDQGVAGLSLGTSGAVRAVVPQPRVDEGLFCYALTRGAWVIGGAISNGGSVQRWAGEVFGPRSATGPEPLTDEAVLSLAESVPPGADGLVALPYLMAERAPLWDPGITGAFLGVRNHHRRGHFIRACVEGVALQLWAIVADLEAVAPVTAVRATGGAFRSALWREVVTDVLDRPVTITDEVEGSALGAAVLALIGIGRADSLAEGLGLLRSADHDPPPLRPDQARAERYRRTRAGLPELFATYRATVSRLEAQVRRRPGGASGSSPGPPM